MKQQLKPGDRVRFGGPNWACGHEFENDDEARTWTGTLVRRDEDDHFEAWVVRPDEGSPVIPDADGTVNALAVALTLEGGPP